MPKLKVIFFNTDGDILAGADTLRDSSHVFASEEEAMAKAPSKTGAIIVIDLGASTYYFKNIDRAHPGPCVHNFLQAWASSGPGGNPPAMLQTRD